MLCDFHTHSYFSGDSEEIPKNMIKRAVSLGMRNICFTDHQDFDYNYDELDFTLNDDKYFREISALKGDIEISVGVETGLEPHLSKRLSEFVSRHPYDFVIGSTHLIRGVDPWYPEYFKEHTDTEGFLLYFEYILETLEFCSDFDVYGHLDYIVRYAPQKDKNYSYDAFCEIIDKILEKLIEMGKGIELNTGGLYKGMKNPNPAPEIIKRYREMGGEIITVGSDAHTADRIGYGFSIAEEMLRSAGFSHYNIFKNRKPVYINL